MYPVREHAHNFLLHHLTDYIYISSRFLKKKDGQTFGNKTVLRIRIRDAFLTHGSGSGRGKKSGSGINNPGHISESLEIMRADPGSGMEKIHIWDPG
jgi:hypothetical protein